MSKFRSLAEITLLENNSFQKRTYEELLRIFNIDSTLKEQLELDLALPLLAKDAYDRVVQKIKEADYFKIGNKIFLSIFPEDIEICIDRDGNYGYSQYDPKTRLITIYCESIKNINEDTWFRANLIHEITHSLSDYVHTEMKGYVSANNNFSKYIAQPAEVEANFSSACDFFVHYITTELKHSMLPNEFTQKSYLQKRIDDYISELTKNEFMLYKDFLNVLSKDKKRFIDFYETLLKACDIYITHNLREFAENSVINHWKTLKRI